MSPSKVFVFNRRSLSLIQLLGISVSLLMVFMAGCRSQPTVTLALLGDLVLGRGVNPRDDSLAYLAPELSSSDLALANLESPLTNAPPISDSPYNLCAPFSRARLLPAWGFNLLSLANNHSSDCGPSGSGDTQLALLSEGIIPIKPGLQPVSLDVNGLKLAFLAFDNISSPVNIDTAVQTIRTLHTNGRLVIVSLHWGVEYQGAPTTRQEFLAQQFAQAGAALIWGHHPHVLQKAAWIQSPSDVNPSTAPTLVLYSLGNALFDQGGLMDTRRSALVVVTIQSKGITSIRVIPFTIDVVDSLVIQPDEESVRLILDRINLP
jgi:poly-gamma-glutamate synthesis protein (capsule biosynthesis protein)